MERKIDVIIPDVLINSVGHNKMPQTGGISNRSLFSHSSGAWEVDDQGDKQVPGGSSLPVLQMSAFSLCLHVLGGREEGGRARSLWL